MMLKFLSAFIITGLLGYTAFLYNDVTPWWIFAVGAFIVGITIPQRGIFTWLASFLAMFLVWVLLAYQANVANEGILAAKMATILPFQGSVNLLMAAGGVVAGLIGGMAALTGGLLRRKHR